MPPLFGNLRNLRNLRYDVPASVVVFLIAIPLSLGIALASGAPIAAGLIAAAVGGIVAGATGGSVLQVSGPAAGLTVIVAELVDTYGWQATCAITVAAGLVQIALGCLRVARAALAISPAIVHGMLAGIGITIALAQVHVVLGGHARSSATDNLTALPGQVMSLNPAAAVAGALTIAVMLLWPKLPAKAGALPPALVAITLATVTAVVAPLDAARVELPGDVLNVHLTPELPEGSWSAVVLAVLTMAVIASIESLLSAVAVDRMHEGPRANLNRELIGQGLANSTSGLLGGMPVTGVIVRSSTNAKAGARSRASAVLHGVWVVVFVALAAGLIEQIPLAALSALLVVVGVRMVSAKEIRHLRQHRELMVYVVTAFGVVELNLLEGVLLGIGVAVLQALYRLTHTKIRTEHTGEHWHVVVEGSLTFAAVPKLNRVLSRVAPGATVDVDLRVDYLDHAAFEALHAWRTTHERLGGRVDIDEIHESWYENAASGTPAGRKSAAATVSAFFPWAVRRPEAAPEAHLLHGVNEFQRITAPQLRAVLAQLSEAGQSPSQLFITCSDSRLVPALMTASGPGDLFTVRNIGNLIPRRGKDGGLDGGDTSVAAAIQYATEVLGVSSITVCGHSGCGAMGALLDGTGTEAAGSPLDEWLRHGAHTMARFRVDSAAEGESGEGTDQARLARLNVIQQLDNLLTHPVVSAGRLRRAATDRDVLRHRRGGDVRPGRRLRHIRSGGGQGHVRGGREPRACAGGCHRMKRSLRRTAAFLAAVAPIAAAPVSCADREPPPRLGDSVVVRRTTPAPAEAGRVTGPATGPASGPTASSVAPAPGPQPTSSAPPGRAPAPVRPAPSARPTSAPGPSEPAPRPTEAEPVPPGEPLPAGVTSTSSSPAPPARGRAGDDGGGGDDDGRGDGGDGDGRGDGGDDDGGDGDDDGEGGDGDDG
ncbi:bifunctional SulP family inorganic anion transporter/carbonic anhydrase [Streptomyces flavidovirens]|uniref:bifunctional SulP family inorganic anion transporter/carbonic anhydrase n=1 Tax=Streptomyces flavidovirens TaxID=67298 RepID=UPI0004032391|nr:bifunctional SulP family inorganic anion transporter/carbonic anhydrase [Streptomyces flavidovirens]